MSAAAVYAATPSPDAHAAQSDMPRPQGFQRETYEQKDISGHTTPLAIHTGHRRRSRAARRAGSAIEYWSRASCAPGALAGRRTPAHRELIFDNACQVEPRRAGLEARRERFRGHAR